MRTFALVAVLVLVGCAGGCALDPGDPVADTDEVASVVSVAISYPRHDDAVGYARAANATRAARDGRLTVVGVTERHVVLRVHVDAHDVTTFPSYSVPEATTCYDLEVGPSGVTGGPRQRPCPVDARPVVLPPPSPVRQIAIGSDAAVRTVLRRTSPTPDAHAVRATVLDSLPQPARGALAPDVLVATAGPDVGVAVHGAEGCLLGSRVGGRVLVWRVPWAQAQPGELSCGPATALARQGITPPH